MYTRNTVEAEHWARDHQRALAKDGLSPLRQSFKVANRLSRDQPTTGRPGIPALAKFGYGQKQSA